MWWAPCSRISNAITSLGDTDMEQATAGRNRKGKDKPWEAVPVYNNPLLFPVFLEGIGLSFSILLVGPSGALDSTS